MLTQLKKVGTEVHRATNLFATYVGKNKVKCPGDVKKFIFLCGANKNNGEPSARRIELIDFSEKHLSNCHFFLAELVFKELSKDEEDSSSDNLLDIETDLSKLADHIIIVLESFSSFTELGAFAYSKQLRKKLIIINNTKFINEKSFINMGPIKAITQQSQQSGYFLHYKMAEGNESIERSDGIGQIFNPLYDILSRNDRAIARTLKKEDLDPSNNFNKDSVRFIHDIILACGPLKLNELIEIAIKIFGKDSFYRKELLKHLGILMAIKIISCKDDFYYSLYKQYYFKYDFDMDSISSMFKVFFLKNNLDRIKNNGNI
ncbi:retron St85 family effector protein [Salmonella enterica]|nr:retron St85 family effector protein [Salmonella enterica]